MPAHPTHLVALNLVIHSPIGMPFTVLSLANHDACSFDPSRGPEYCHSFTHRIAFHSPIFGKS